MTQQKNGQRSEKEFYKRGYQKDQQTSVLNIVIEKMQIEAKKRDHYTPTRMTKVIKTCNIKIQKGYEVTRTRIPGWQECQLFYPLWQTGSQSLLQFNGCMFYVLAILLIGIHPKEIHTYCVPKDTYENP